MNFTSSYEFQIIRGRFLYKNWVIKNIISENYANNNIRSGITNYPVADYSWNANRPICGHFSTRDIVRSLDRDRSRDSNFRGMKRGVITPRFLWNFRTFDIFSSFLFFLFPFFFLPPSDRSLWGCCERIISCSIPSEIVQRDRWT